MDWPYVEKSGNSNSDGAMLYNGRLGLWRPFSKTRVIDLSL